VVTFRLAPSRKGWMYPDFATDDGDATPHVIEYGADEWTEYEVGKNNRRTGPFEAQAVVLNPTTEAYVKFNDPDGPVDKLEANMWTPYPLRVRKLYVKGVSAPGVLRLKAYG